MAGLLAKRVFLTTAAACAAGLAVLAAAAESGTTLDRMVAAAPEQDGPHLLREEPVSPIPQPRQTDPARVALGDLLFHDPRLSHAGNRACSTCHDTSTNGAGASVLDTGSDGKPLKRNTSTVFNAALSYRQNWSADAATLQDQARAGFAGFMATDWPEAVGRLNADAVMRTRFTVVFDGPATADNVVEAVAAYEQTLLTPDSRFDRWLRGDDTALSAQELAGYKLFKSVGCVSCHQGVNIGGNLKERVGIFMPLPGKDSETLRVPSLRNIAVTAPYFDNGSAPTLEDAVQRMAHAQLGRELTRDQVGDIVSFLGTLTGRFGGRPLQAAR